MPNYHNQLIFLIFAFLYTFPHVEAVYRNVYNQSESLSIKFYLSNSKSFSPNVAQIIWESDGIVFSEENLDKKLIYRGLAPLTTKMQNNGTIFGHVVLISNESATSMITTEQLNTYLPRKTIKFERYLLEAINETLLSSDDQAKLNEERISFWKPYITAQVVVDHSQYNSREAFPAIARYYMKVERRTFYPILWLDPDNTAPETEELYSQWIPVNSSLSEVPIMIEFSLIPLSTFEWQRQLELAFKVHESYGMTQQDIKQMKSMFYETSPTLLYVTGVVSVLHLLFDFLAFKNDVGFWRKKDNLEGVSVQTVFLNIVSQTIVLLYLIDNETSKLVLASVSVGLMIEVWKFLKSFRFSKTTAYQQSATRVYDKMAMKYVGILLLPAILGYSVYSLIYKKHAGYYSWFVSSLVSVVYALGFVRMTPQLFINYKLKSVAHLPWRVFIYKAMNTFIDDLFAFIIKMPTMHRLACFRDDIVFLIYLYQRWIYKVDHSRSSEYSEEKESEPEKRTKID